MIAVGSGSVVPRGSSCGSSRFLLLTGRAGHDMAGRGKSRCARSDPGGVNQGGVNDWGMRHSCRRANLNEVVGQFNREVARERALAR